MLFSFRAKGKLTSLPRRTKSIWGCTLCVCVSVVVKYGSSRVKIANKRKRHKRKRSIKWFSVNLLQRIKLHFKSNFGDNALWFNGNIDRRRDTFIIFVALCFLSEKQVPSGHTKIFHIIILRSYRYRVCGVILLSLVKRSYTMERYILLFDTLWSTIFIRILFN